MNTISYDKFIMSLTNKAYNNDVPINGSFELTPFCNFNCKMCYVHLEKKMAEHLIYSGKQWIKIMKEAIDSGMIYALLTGGEAMMHPDFWSIYMFLINQGILVRIKSNGLLLTDENIKKFITYSPCQIDVSLYGCDSQSYLTITGVDAYKKVIENIQKAITAGLRIRIMITPSIFMRPWTKQIFELAKSFGTQVIVNDLLIEPNKNTGRKKSDFDLDEIEINKILKLKRELFPVEIKSNDEEDILTDIKKRAHIPEKGLYCNGGRTAFAINWDGTMGPCLSFPRNIICAHPFKDGFSHSWEEVNRGIKKFIIPQKCHSCEINTKCHYCPVQHSKVVSENLCDSSVCAYWHNKFK